MKANGIKLLAIYEQKAKEVIAKLWEE